MMKKRYGEPCRWVAARSSKRPGCAEGLAYAYRGLTNDHRRAQAEASTRLPGGQAEAASARDHPARGPGHADAVGGRIRPVRAGRTARTLERRSAAHDLRPAVQ